MAEPILWAHKAQRTQLARRWNSETQQHEVVVDEFTGRPRIARVPQRAHDAGDPDNPRAAQFVPWVHILRADGHVVRAPLSMASSDVEGREQYGRVMLQKYVALGWIPYGVCPIARVAGGLLQDYQVIDPELRGEIRSGTARACTGQHGPERPCPHFQRELAARIKANNHRNELEARSYKSETDRLLESQQRQTTEIVQGVAGALADALRAVQPEPSTSRRRGQEP